MSNTDDWVYEPSPWAVSALAAVLVTIAICVTISSVSDNHRHVSEYDHCIAAHSVTDCAKTR